MPLTDVSLCADDAVICFRGVNVPHSPFVTEAVHRRLVDQSYEAHLIQAALATIQPGDKVLELGAGLGIVGAVIAKEAAPDMIWSYEADPDLLPCVRALHERNELGSKLPQPRPLSQLGYERHTNSSAKDVHTALTSDEWAERLQAAQGEISPDVLILNMAGAELALIPHVALLGARKLVIGFCPHIYGKDGAQKRKRALKAAGWTIVKDASSRLAWACERVAPKEIGAPKPEGGWSEGIATLQHAVIQPRVTGLLSSPSGVQTEDGDDVPLAAHWRHARRMTLPFPRPDEPIQRLKGRYLWGGIFYRVFSHFMAESLGRLWAASADIGTINGIVYVLRRPERPKQPFAFQTDLIRAMGLDVPVHLIQAPTRIDELVVPGQGFGLGPIITGTQRYRDHVASTFGKDIPPDGPEKLYISRSLLRNDLGGLLGETVLEAHLRDEGYEAFYPEKHDIPTQIARYKAAKRVIACDGSALHLLAFCAGADCQVALIARRKSFANKQIRKHITSFSGHPPLPVRHLKFEWQRPGNQRKRNSIGEPDMPAIYRTLHDAGFVEGQIAWPDLPDDLAAALRKRGYVRTS